jgi:hypothetical protein
MCAARQKQKESRLRLPDSLQIVNVLNRLRTYRVSFETQICVLRPHAALYEIWHA